MPYRTEIKVRGYHLDLYGHVNNARYLEFLEEARWNMMELHGDLEWFMQRRYALVVSRIDIRYKRPATMGDLLVVETRSGEMGERHVIVEQKIVRADNGKVVAEAEVTVAVVHPETPGALPMQGEIAERFAQLVGEH
ncbi:acyl-CoA thioesterase [Silvimonas soli]|uniref:acyl-CoA thioesterase n=1 Tax=Silvimonas soli TaxID=2980100 RepID=UPI0024B351EF|nr:thioesterase family protein [Silvimonas soli]